MDDHNSHAAMQPAHNLDGLHNGMYSNHYDPSFPDPSNNGFDQPWAYNETENVISSAHSVPGYGQDWSSYASLQNADAYGRTMSRSPAAVTHQASPYSHYPDPAQFARASAYDPALTGSTSNNTLYPTPPIYRNQPSPGVTISPNALENTPSQQSLGFQRSASLQPPVDQNTLISAIPQGDASGSFYIVGSDKLTAATNSRRLNDFVNIGQQDFEFPINKAVVPSVSLRRSRNELRRLAINDPKLLAKLGKKILKKTLSQPSGSTQVLSKPATKPVQTASGVKYVAPPSDESSDESSSEDDSDDDFIEPSPLPAKRSEDSPRDAVRYDTIKALWRPRKKVLSTPDIRNGLKDFWEVVRTIRDRWKTDTAAVKAAEEQGKKGELPLLKSRVRDQREMIETAFRAAQEHGHRGILELSSENVSFLFLCYQFLSDRYTNDDTNGPLARLVLDLVAMCTTLDEEKLTKTYWVKLLPKVAKKGDADVQSLIKRINSEAKEGTKRNQELNKDKKPAAQEQPLSPTVKSPPSKTGSVPATGVKRPAPAGSTTGQPAKRVANGAAAPDAGLVAAKPAAVKKPLVPAVKPKAGAATGAGVTKTKMTASKPSTFFNAMANTNKKPATAAKPAAASVVATLKAAEKKAAAAAPKEPATSSASYFGSLMADLTKKEEKPPSPKSEQVSPEETPEQKKRRLRKEARRGLRVTFKPESSLCEIRLFTHDPDEELGHDASMTRDVSDVGSEGRMFKQHKDTMEVDEEEDDTGEEEVKPWRQPSPIDFDDVPPDERGRNYEQFGGGQIKLESAEKTAREQHDANTLMVFYADGRDVPANPKEAAEEMDVDTSAPSKEFGTPGEEVRQKAAKFAVRKQETPTLAPALPQVPTGGQDLSALLAALQPQAQQPPAAAVPQPSPGGMDLSALLASFGNAASQQQAVPPPPVNFQAPNPPPNFANFMAAQQGQQIQPPPFPPPQGGQPVAPQLAALLAQLGQNPGAAPPPPNPMGFPAGFPPMPPLPFLPPPPQFQQPSQGGYPGENEERRRMREGVDNGQNRRQGGRKEEGSNHFSQVCKYYASGKCRKGDKCTYLHQ